jgi:putative tricarboxylic transport membrane protein
VLGDIFRNLAIGFGNVFNVYTLLLMCAGILLGIIAGAIPGLGSVLVMGITLPLTYNMSASNAILFLVAIFKGATMGGSFSSVLLNVPGTASAAATAFDGFPLAAKGQSRKALHASIFGSGLGDLLSDVVLIFGVATLARAALKLGSPEKFLILLLALTLAAMLVGKNPFKGIISICLGLLLGTVGLDSTTGLPRLGVIPVLGKLEGLDSTAILVGLLALSEIIAGVSSIRKESLSGKTKKPMEILGEGLTLRDCRESTKAFFSGTIIGTVFGILPGLGSSAAAFASYAFNKLAYGGKTKSGVKFGEGAVPGVIACESANSAVSGANLIPLLTLGIPGDAAAALLLAAFMIHGIAPGPGIVTQQAGIIYTIFAGFIVANLLNIALGLLVSRPIALILRSKLSIVYPIVTIICLAGIYSINGRMMDVGIFIAMGALGYILKKCDIPLAPAAIGFILARNLEQYFRQSMSVSQGSLSIFWGSTACKVILAILAAFIVWIIVSTIRNKRKSQKEAAHENG